MAITKILRSIKPSANALVWGLGNSADPFQWGEANKNALEMRLKTLATSGDSRGLYAKMQFGGAGGGEVLRTWAEAVASGVANGGTINGIHHTVSVAASSSISGAGNASRHTVGAAAQSRTLGGTVAAVQLDSDIGTGNTVPASWAFMRFTDSGAVRLGNLMNVPAPANGTMFAAHTTQVMTHSLKIVDATGAAYYLMCTDAATNRS